MFEKMIPAIDQLIADHKAAIARLEQRLDQMELTEEEELLAFELKTGTRRARQTLKDLKKEIQTYGHGNDR